MITLDSSTSTALAAANFEYAYLCKIPGSFYYTNNNKDLTFGGNTYSSSGLLLNFSEVTKDHSLKVGSYTLTLSNVNTTLAQGYSAASYRGQEAIIYLAILSSSGAITGTPLILYKGTLDTWAVNETKTGSDLQLKITSHWASYNLKTGRYTNDATQQQIHSGDKFFQYSHSDVENIGWGK